MRQLPLISARARWGAGTAPPPAKGGSPKALRPWNRTQKKSFHGLGMQIGSWLLFGARERKSTTPPCITHRHLIWTLITRRHKNPFWATYIRLVWNLEGPDQVPCISWKITPTEDEFTIKNYSSHKVNNCCERKPASTANATKFRTKNYRYKAISEKLKSCKSNMQ